MVGRHVDGPSALTSVLASAAEVDGADLERGPATPATVWCVAFPLHPSAAVTERAADLVAARCLGAGVGLVVRFRAAVDPGRLLRLPPLPLHAFRHLETLAVEVPDAHYLSDRGTLVLPTGTAMAHAVATALHQEVDAGHCRGDQLLASLDALAPPAALARAVAGAVASHAERYLVDALGNGAAAVTTVLSGGTAAAVTATT